MNFCVAFTKLTLLFFYMLFSLMHSLIAVYVMVSPCLVFTEERGTSILVIGANR